jgi:hypothetical protein
MRQIVELSLYSLVNCPQRVAEQGVYIMMTARDLDMMQQHFSAIKHYRANVLSPSHRFQKASNWTRKIGQLSDSRL